VTVKTDINALIVFVDIRGFTTWAEKTGNSSFLDEFAGQWYAVLGKNFKQTALLKHLGDGALIVKEISEKTTSVLLKSLLLDTLKAIGKTTVGFKALCKKFAEEEGTKINLELGWGIAKGPLKRVNGDYIGADLNKCSRYCDIARPFGIVIDADDFQNLPSLQSLNIELTKQTRLLKGIHEDADVWVTKEVAEQFIPREDLRENPEVHVAGICFKKEKDSCFVLLGKRNRERRLYPGLFEGCGGQLARNELFHEGVIRHYKKEYHIEVKVFEDVFGLYHINENNEPKIPGIRFLCEYVSGTPSSRNHIPPTPQWFTEAEFKSLPREDFIPGLKDEIKKLFDNYKERKHTS
jgi:class 3 adenylate cyclase